MSLRGAGRILIRPTAAAVVLLAALPVSAQYPGQVARTDKDTPQLRAVAVLEWTGDAAQPKASRLVPVSVFDGEQLQDGGIYLARPQPLALDSQVEYQLQDNGRVVGLFDVDSASLQQSAWIGLGARKPLPKPKPQPVQAVLTGDWGDDVASDRPILHRKPHPDEKPGAGGSGSASTTNAPPPDSDRPTLHRSDSSDSSSASSAPPPDSDRPVLHSSTADSSSSTSDADRPKLKKKKTEDAGYVESMSGTVDPNRPRLMRGKPAGSVVAVEPTLVGLPPEMEQMVAVSDARNTPDHPWSYIWANPDDAVRMKEALEEIARKDLGLAPPAPPATSAPRRTASHKKTTPPPAAPEPLANERFRVFELAYGSGATLVLSAETPGSGAQKKYVTLIAQPDLYGNVAVLLKNVTDAAHLDLTPRMRLVDAVDALADNRGELLFELRGATQRQFALYRVLRGQASQIFVTGGGPGMGGE